MPLSASSTSPARHWIPFAALYVLRLGDSDSPRRGQWPAGGAVHVFQAWAELTYASFLLIFCAIYLVWRLPSLWAGPGPAATTLRSLALGFAVAALVFSLGITPFLAAMLPDMLREGDFFASGGGFADVFSADLMGYLAPTRLHPLLGDWAAQLPSPTTRASTSTWATACCTHPCRGHLPAQAVAAGG